eukprot:m.359926 g.359926  ORF g.359926 m.359926 type:complete len:1359 (-) comp18824_c0_seq1:482-4558(-)
MLPLLYKSWRLSEAQPMRMLLAAVMAAVVMLSHASSTPCRFGTVGCGHHQLVTIYHNLQSLPILESLHQASVAVTELGSDELDVGDIQILTAITSRAVLYADSGAIRYTQSEFAEVAAMATTLLDAIVTTQASVDGLVSREVARTLAAAIVGLSHVMTSNHVPVTAVRDGIVIDTAHGVVGHTCREREQAVSIDWPDMRLRELIEHSPSRFELLAEVSAMIGFAGTDQSCHSMNSLARYITKFHPSIVAVNMPCALASDKLPLSSVVYFGGANTVDKVSMGLDIVQSQCLTATIARHFESEADEFQGALEGVNVYLTHQGVVIVEYTLNAKTIAQSRQRDLESAVRRGAISKEEAEAVSSERATPAPGADLVAVRVQGSIECDVMGSSSGFDWTSDAKKSKDSESHVDENKCTVAMLHSGTADSDPHVVCECSSSGFVGAFLVLDEGNQVLVYSDGTAQHVGNSSPSSPNDTSAASVTATAIPKSVTPASDENDQNPVSMPPGPRKSTAAPLPTIIVTGSQIDGGVPVSPSVSTSSAEGDGASVSKLALWRQLSRYLGTGVAAFTGAAIAMAVHMVTLSGSIWLWHTRSITIQNKITSQISLLSIIGHAAYVTAMMLRSTTSSEAAKVPFALQLVIGLASLLWFLCLFATTTVAERLSTNTGTGRNGFQGVGETASFSLDTTSSSPAVSGSASRATNVSWSTVSASLNLFWRLALVLCIVVPLAVIVPLAVQEQGPFKDFGTCTYGDPYAVPESDTEANRTLLHDLSDPLTPVHGAADSAKSMNESAAPAILLHVSTKPIPMFQAEHVGDGASSADNGDNGDGGEGEVRWCLSIVSNESNVGLGVGVLVISICSSVWWIINTVRARTIGTRSSTHQVAHVLTLALWIAALLSFQCNTLPANSSSGGDSDMSQVSSFATGSELVAPVAQSLYTVLAIVQAVFLLVVYNLWDADAAYALRAAPVFGHIVSRKKRTPYKMRLETPTKANGVVDQSFKLAKTGSGYALLTPRVSSEHLRKNHHFTGAEFGMSTPLRTRAHPGDLSSAYAELSAFSFSLNDSHVSTNDADTTTSTHPAIADGGDNGSGRMGRLIGLRSRGRPTTTALDNAAVKADGNGISISSSSASSDDELQFGFGGGVVDASRHPLSGDVTTLRRTPDRAWGTHNASTRTNPFNTPHQTPEAVDSSRGSTEHDTPPTLVGQVDVTSAVDVGALPFDEIFGQVLEQDGSPVGDFQRTSSSSCSTGPGNGSRSGRRTSRQGKPKSDTAVVSSSSSDEELDRVPLRSKGKSKKMLSNLFETAPIASSSQHQYAASYKTVERMMPAAASGTASTPQRGRSVYPDADSPGHSPLNLPSDSDGFTSC